MATSRSESLKEWPYEYKGWRITFTVESMPHPQTGTPPLLLFSVPKVEHLHEFDKQSVRWTKRQRVDKKTFERKPVEEQLCCFICAKYMPDDVWTYFEKCREMTRCANL